MLHYRQRLPVYENYVGKLERGVVRWPGALYREAIVAVLGAAHERDLGFGPTGARRAASADPAEELGAPMSMAAASTRLLDAMAPTPWPARVGHRRSIRSGGPRGRSRYGTTCTAGWRVKRPLRISDGPRASYRAHRVRLIYGPTCCRLSATSPTHVASWHLIAMRSMTLAGC